MSAITEEQVRERLRTLAAAETQKALAARLGVSEPYLSDVLRGARKPGRKVQEALGIRRREVYEGADGGA